MGAKVCVILLKYLRLTFYRTASEVSSGQGTAVTTEQCLNFSAGKILQGISVCCRTHSLNCSLAEMYHWFTTLMSIFKKKNVTVPLVNPTAS